MTIEKAILEKNEAENADMYIARVIFNYYRAHVMNAIEKSGDDYDISARGTWFAAKRNNRIILLEIVEVIKGDNHALAVRTSTFCQRERVFTAFTKVSDLSDRRHINDVVKALDDLIIRHKASKKGLLGKNMEDWKGQYSGDVWYAYVK